MNTGTPIDPILHYGFICPKCRQRRNLIRGVSETEMMCGTCGYHLRKGDIHFIPDKRPKHFFVNRLRRIPIIGR